MKDRYTFGWHDPESIYQNNEPIEVVVKANIPLWFSVVVKIIYWLKRKK